MHDQKHAYIKIANVPHIYFPNRRAGLLALTAWARIIGPNCDETFYIAEQAGDSTSKVQCLRGTRVAFIHSFGYSGHSTSHLAGDIMFS